jgi:quercetin dioxygenase-like cupin family protein
MATILKLKEGTRFQMGAGNTRKVVYPGMGAKNLTLNYIVFGPGHEFPQHDHDESEDVFVVLEGSGVLKQGKIERPIKAGDVVFVPAGEIHGTVAGPEGMVCISCQAPPDRKLYSGEREAAKRSDS